MAEMINFDKVTTLLLQHGEWYEVNPGTLISIPAADFLSGHSGTMHLPGKVTVPGQLAHAVRSYSSDIQREREERGAGLAIAHREKYTPASWPVRC